MPVLNCYITDDTLKRLRAVVRVIGRSVEDLAECAIEDSAIQAVPLLNGRPTDRRFDAVWDLS